MHHALDHKSAIVYPGDTKKVVKIIVIPQYQSYNYPTVPDRKIDIFDA